MSVQDFIIKYLILIFTTASIFLFPSVYFAGSKRSSISIKIAAALAFVHTVVLYVEANTDVYMVHIIFSIIFYILQPLMVIALISATSERFSWLRCIPAGINALVALTALFSPIMFSYTADGRFVRGPLGYTSHVVCYLYIIILCIRVIRIFFSNYKSGGNVIFFGALSVIIASVLETLQIVNVTDTMVSICCLIFQLFLYIQYNSRDTLTNAFNRATYYSDTQKEMRHITGVISLDLNGLKSINDREGHTDGDRALRTMAHCMTESVDYRSNVYRVGGDEFAIVCFDVPEDEILQIVNDVQAKMDESEYNCSIGYAFQDGNKSMDDLEREADHKMYENKRAYYARCGGSSCRVLCNEQQPSD